MPGPAPEPVPPDVLARVERVLASRNRGGVPLEIACRILDDMADAVSRVRRMSCGSLTDRGLHQFCSVCYPKETP